MTLHSNPSKISSSSNRDSNDNEGKMSREEAGRKGGQTSHRGRGSNESGDHSSSSSQNKSSSSSSRSK